MPHPSQIVAWISDCVQNVLTTHILQQGLYLTFKLILYSTVDLDWGDFAGLTAAMAEVFKQGHRVQLLKVAPRVWQMALGLLSSDAARSSVVSR